MAPPRRISRDAIVATSLAIVDEEGLEALVIRNIAKRLGVQPGALYNHFRDMDEIKAEVVWEATKVVGTIRPISKSWPEAARLHVTAFLEGLLRHPNVMPLLVGRAGQQIWVRRLYAGYGGYLESFLRLLAADGITGRRALTVIESLEAFTIGIATVAVAMNDETSVLGPPSGFEPNPRLERLVARAGVNQKRARGAGIGLPAGWPRITTPPANQRQVAPAVWFGGNAGQHVTTAAVDDTDRANHIPGEAGMWVVIFVEMALFAVCFLLYLFERSKDLGAFRASQDSLSQSLGALNTVLLLTSSLFVYVGLQAVRRRLPTIAPKLFSAALVCGVAFCVVKAFEWGAKFSDGLVPSTNTFYLYYFIITGMHLFDVLLGIGALVFLLVQSRRPEPSVTTMMFMEGGALWWHMVDLNWMILFPLLYLAR